MKCILCKYLDTKQMNDGVKVICTIRGLETKAISKHTKSNCELYRINNK